MSLDTLPREKYLRAGLTPPEQAAAEVRLSRPAVHVGQRVETLFFRPLTVGEYARVMDAAVTASGDIRAGEQVITTTVLATGLPREQVERLAGADFPALAEAVGKILGPTVPSGGGEESGGG